MFWLIHTVRERNQGRYRELDKHDGKQWVLVPFPFWDECEHFCTIYQDPFVPVMFPVLVPVPFLLPGMSIFYLVNWRIWFPQKNWISEVNLIFLTIMPIGILLLNNQTRPRRSGSWYPLMNSSWKIIVGLRHQPSANCYQFLQRSKPFPHQMK